MLLRLLLLFALTTACGIIQILHVSGVTQFQFDVFEFTQTVIATAVLMMIPDAIIQANRYFRLFNEVTHG